MRVAKSKSLCQFLLLSLYSRLLSYAYADCLSRLAKIAAEKKPPAPPNPAAAQLPDVTATRCNTPLFDHEHSNRAYSTYGVLNPAIRFTTSHSHSAYTSCADRR